MTNRPFFQMNALLRVLFNSPMHLNKILEPNLVNRVGMTDGR